MIANASDKKKKKKILKLSERTTSSEHETIKYHIPTKLEYCSS